MLFSQHIFFLKDCIYYIVTEFPICLKDSHYGLKTSLKKLAELYV